MDSGDARVGAAAAVAAAGLTRLLLGSELKGIVLVIPGAGVAPAVDDAAPPIRDGAGDDEGEGEGTGVGAADDDAEDDDCAGAPTTSTPQEDCRAEATAVATEFALLARPMLRFAFAELRIEASKETLEDKACEREPPQPRPLPGADSAPGMLTPPPALTSMTPGPCIWPSTQWPRCLYQPLALQRSVTLSTCVQ